ncbi:MAG TPA: hypothetical protein VGJ32_06185 [Solirubrobacteraceae bacterium]|jgi:hypothetical protein
MGLRPPSDRRASCADELARALLHSSEPLTFEQLNRRAPSATIRDVAAWLGNAVEAGLIEEVGAERLRERRFRLRPRGADVLTSARRDGDGEIAAA